MFTTPHDNNFKLCLHWLYNAKNNILNEEILNLQISMQGSRARTLQTVKTLIKTSLNENQEEILEDTENSFATKLYSIYFASAANIPDIYYEQNRNIIFITLSTPNFSKIHRPILCVSLKSYSLDLNSRYKKDPINEDLLHMITKELDNFQHKPIISQKEEYINYIKKLPLLELMKNKEYEKIGNFTFNIILRKPYPYIFRKILMNTKYQSNKYGFKDLIVDCKYHST